MNNGDLTIQVRGESIVLLPERCAFWPAESTLLVADPHWGKAATFRTSGIPVPSGTTEGTLSRLRSAVQRTNAVKIVFLGDLLHAREGRSSDMFAALATWRESAKEIEVTLVRGNHDRRAGDPPPDLNIGCVDAPFQSGPFVFAHHPGTSTSGYVIAGHVHPAVRLHGAGRQFERLPCFVIGRERAILPAFGEFTGLADIESDESDNIYTVADGQVIPIN